MSPQLTCITQAFEICFHIVYGGLYTNNSRFPGLGINQLNAKVVISECSLSAEDFRDDLEKLEGSGAARDTALLALISRLIDELQEHQASAGLQPDPRRLGY